MDYRIVWGKARSAAPQPHAFHPAAYHMADVAAVAERLTALFPSPFERFSEACGADRSDAGALFIRLAAIHDIGKFAPQFQAKAPAHWPDCYGSTPVTTNVTADHTRAGALLLRLLGTLLRPLLAADVDPTLYRLLTTLAAGHHGRPITIPDLQRDQDFQSSGRPFQFAKAFAQDAVALISAPPFPTEITEPVLARYSYSWAGLLTLADWIGSDERRFPYCPPDQPLAEYFDQVARPSAAVAVAAAGVGPSRPSRASGFQALTARTDPPSPLQVFAEGVLLPDGPVLALVEDVTGSGKTEAALILAHRLMQYGRADGLFLALPTMATANAMYDRLSASYRRLFDAQSEPSLVMAHGAAGLHVGFRSSVLDGPVPASTGEVGEDSSAAAYCARWIADDRRRAFFADVGVGTIDQALMAVLPAKYAMLRLAGLSRRILIVDEAHAYDAYMTEELQTLVSFHAAQGGSTIVLSATLPELVKRSMIQSYTAGLGLTAHRSAAALPAAYPAVTLVGGDGLIRTQGLDTRAPLRRTVPVRRLADADAAIAEVVDAARAGAAVAWIRNTVDDALDAFGRLVEAGVDVGVFHARFAMVDRLAIERQVMETFGPGSRPEQRRGKVLIATQVVEQSLDLDFDVLVSDLAPIDLMIQRAGRLQRHPARDRPAVDGALRIVSPEPSRDADANWYRRSFPRAAAVYPDHARLWKSAAVLFAAGAIVAPRSIRDLIEAAYCSDALDDVPKALERVRDQTEGARHAERSHARGNLLKLDPGYVAGNGAWDAEARIPTRLADPRKVLRLALIFDGEIRPYASVEPAPSEGAERALRRAWALSEVSISARRVATRGPYHPPIEEAAKALETDWEAFGQHDLVAIRNDRGDFCCDFIGPSGVRCRADYRTDTGLQVRPLETK